MNVIETVNVYRIDTLHGGTVFKFKERLYLAVDKKDEPFFGNSVYGVALDGGEPLIIKGTEFVNVVDGAFVVGAKLPKPEVQSETLTKPT